VNFVRRLRNQSATPQRLDIRAETLASGPVLSGTVGGFGRWPRGEAEEPSQAARQLQLQQSLVSKNSSVPINRRQQCRHFL
jgi:hypothetical protein